MNCLIHCGKERFWKVTRFVNPRSANTTVYGINGDTGKSLWELVDYKIIYINIYI